MGGVEAGIPGGCKACPAGWPSFQGLHQWILVLRKGDGALSGLETRVASCVGDSRRAALASRCDAEPVGVRPPPGPSHTQDAGDEETMRRQPPSESHRDRRCSQEYIGGKNSL